MSFEDVWDKAIAGKINKTNGMLATEAHNRMSRAVKQVGKMMTMTNDYISILRKYLSTKADAYGITKIGIFGSVARNEQTEDSDVDVCVEMKKPDLFTMVHIKEELQELFGKPVDIVRLRKNMNPMLLKQIERDGIYA